MIDDSKTIRRPGAILTAMIGAATCCGAADAQMLAPVAAPPQSPQPGAPPPDVLPGGTSAVRGAPLVLRWTEDWRPAPGKEPTSLLDRIRYLPLGRPDIYLSLGGELRYYYNDYDHATLGIRPGDRNSLTQERVRLIGDLHVTPILRAFVEVGHNRELGAERVTPPNRGDWDVEQAFVDVTLPIAQDVSLTLRPGRFEMPLGSGKLVGLREGINRRFLYQGVQGVLRQKGRFALDVFTTRPLATLPGAWDDRPDRSRRFSGAYLATSRGVLIPDSGVDVYFYDVDRATARYASIAGREERMSVGLRLYGRKNHWDYDLEGVYQFGDVAGVASRNRIRAWATLFEAGYSFPAAAWTPRIGIRANAFSGDRNAADGTLNTFSAPALKAPLFTNGDAAWFSESNIVDVFPMVTVRPARGVQLIAGPDLVWRQQRGDAVYAVPTLAPLVTPAPGSRFVAATYNLQADWTATKRLGFRAFYNHLVPSQALRQRGGRTSNFLGLQADYRF